MRFYFVHENNQLTKLDGEKNSDYYEQAIELTEAEPRHSGFLGVIDNTGRLRGTLAVNQYRGKFRPSLFDFIRKYRGLQVLEKLAKEIKGQLNAT